MLKKINIKEIEDNHILAETLQNKYNQVLLTKGTHLEKSKHFRILAMWGIQEITVYESISDEIINKENKSNKAEVEREILNILNWTIKENNDKFLFDIAVLVKNGDFSFE